MSPAAKLPTPGDPGRAVARRARAAIEEALLGLVAMPVVLERESLRDRLLRAIQCIYAVQDSPVVAMVHLDGLREALAIVGEVSAMLGRAEDPSAVPTLGAALARLAAASDDLLAASDAVAAIQLARRTELVGNLDVTGVPPARPFRASRATPELHAIIRPPLLLWVDVGANPPESAPVPVIAFARPGTLDDLRAFSASAASGELAQRVLADSESSTTSLPAPEALPPLAYEPAIEEIELLRRLGRDCLEDVANHRNLRKPNELESWLDQEPFEIRLLRNVDAFAAVGAAALPQVSLFHAEATTPDPERAFAAALTLGCIEGSDTVGAAVMCLKQSAPETFPGWIEGLWLAPNPAIDGAMADLSEGSRLDLAALALDVLHLRGATPEATVRALLSHRDAAICARIARALGSVLPRRDAIQALDALVADTDDDGVFCAAIESLLLRRSEPMLLLLRETSAMPAPSLRAQRARELLCLVGRASDVDRLLDGVSAAPSVKLVRGLGRFGHVDAIPRLIGLLAHDDAVIAAAAAEALDRITGAGLRQIIEEPWDIELPPEAADSGGLPVPTRKVERVVTDPAQWAAWVNDEARTLDARLKTRGGVAFTPLQIVAELEARSTPPDRREEAALELALVTGTPSLFSPHDWVGRQKKHLAELRARVAVTAFPPGAWAVSSAMHPREVESAPAADPVESLAPPQEFSPHEDEPRTTRPMGPIVPRNPLPFQPVPANPSLTFQAPTAPRSPEISRPGWEQEHDAATVTMSHPIIVPAKPVLPFRSTLVERARDPASSSDESYSPTSAAPREGARKVPIAPPVPVHFVADIERANPTEPHSGGATAPQLSPEARNHVNSISLAQYSGLCAAITAFPDRVVEIHAHYGLDQHACNALNALWGERFRRDPQVKQRWELLVADARARQGR